MSTYVREVAAELARLGCRVDVFTRHDGNGNDRVVEIVPGARLVHIEAGGHREIDKLALYDYVPEFASNVADFRERAGLSYDLVFSHYWLSGCVGDYLGFWWRVPHLAMFHTLGAVKNAIGVGRPEPKLRLATEATLVRNADAVIASTALERDQLVGYYGASASRIRVIPCGVNRERFRPGPKAAARDRLNLDQGGIILYVGRLEPLKGVERVIRALPLMPANVRLLVVGGDARSRTEEKRLRRLAAALGVTDRVLFVGTVAHELLPDYYRAANVCVVPSHYESFCLVALEALASGTPVVAGDVGIMRQVIRDGENGYILTDTSAVSLSARLAALADDAAPAVATPESISASVAAYGWPSVAALLHAECRALVGQLQSLSV